MADTHIFSQQLPKDVPDWFRGWANDVNTKLRKLFTNLNAGMILDQNLSAQVVTLSVLDGGVITIRHRLGRVPSTVLAGPGRMVCFELLEATSSYIVVKPKLWSTQTTSTSNVKSNSITVLDSTILRAQDVVKIDVDQRTITNIAGNRLTLSDKVDISSTKCVSLAVETVTFILV